MKRIYLSILILLFGVSLIPNNLYAQDEISVNLNGNIIQFKHQPIMKNGTVMVPFRELFNAMGLIINYDPKTKLIRGQQDVFPWTEVALTPGKIKAQIQGEDINLTESPFVIDGNTYVPLRFVGEATKAKVSWVPLTKTVIINELPEPLLERLCKIGDVAGVKKVLAENPNLDVNDDKRQYLLRATLNGKSLGVIQALVNAGADVNKINSLDATPLMMASYVSTEAVQWLLDHGADPNIKNSEGHTAFSSFVTLDLEERKKTAELLKKYTLPEVEEEVSDTIINQPVLEELPYNISLPESKLNLTVQDVKENELGYIFSIKSINSSSDKYSLGASQSAGFSYRVSADNNLLKHVSYQRVSGNDTIGLGSAVYELIIEKPSINVSRLNFAIKDGFFGKEYSFDVNVDNLSSASLGFEHLQSYLKNNYSQVLTDSGITDFKINVWKWIGTSYMIDVEYDTQFFWQKDVMTPAVQEQLRNHMKLIARDVLERFPDISFVGRYNHSWYRYPNLKMDLRNSSHMTWDTQGNGNEPDMPYKFRWTTENDDKLNLF